MLPSLRKRVEDMAYPSKKYEMILQRLQKKGLQLAKARVTLAKLQVPRGRGLGKLSDVARPRVSRGQPQGSPILVPKLPSPEVPEGKIKPRRFQRGRLEE